LGPGVSRGMTTPRDRGAPRLSSSPGGDSPGGRAVYCPQCRALFSKAGCRCETPDDTLHGFSRVLRRQRGRFSEPSIDRTIKYPAKPFTIRHGRLASGRNRRRSDRVCHRSAYAMAYAHRCTLACRSPTTPAQRSSRRVRVPGAEELGPGSSGLRYCGGGLGARSYRQTVSS
jgi:hypothetical protein